ncbi:hypothetical protein [Streptomyces lydicus]|uniref:hypothetical protein n=1 Tax=Streptomyces lydicus TaxID=47763 RepID=UPI0010135730|nr:hypothetical protein [Streptomyces lydicus]MCZ1006349.1 hypothetical protein [Streptomyces lydicus]
MSYNVRNAAREIARAHKAADMPGVADEVRYALEFAYDGQSLACFEATAPLPIPLKGQEIVVHGVPAVVLAVQIAYENAEPGDGPSVFVTVDVEPRPDH